MTIEKLPFCTPIFSFTSSTSRTLDTSCSLRLFVETYFYWGDKAAVPINEREVQLFDLPTHQSSFGALCAYLLTGLSYLTGIIPLIVFIAKAILRCGTDYTIQPTPQLTAPQTPARSTRVNGQIESSSGSNALPSTTRQEDLSGHCGSTIETEDREIEDGENLSVSDVLSEYYFEKGLTTIDFIAEWFQRASTGEINLEEDIQETISYFAPAVLWNSLVKCTQLYLSNPEKYEDNPTFKLIYTKIIDTLNNKRSKDDPNSSPMQKILKDYPESFLEPPSEIIEVQVKLYKKYFGTDSQASPMGISAYFPALNAEETLPL